MWQHNLSGDDLQGWPQNRPQNPERRARSVSPVKTFNAILLPPYVNAAKSASSDDLLSTVSMPSSVSADRLRELSRLPISRKLHITRANYAIPIPFTLQLPPKLSAPSTPKSSNASVALSPRSPSRLVFTGRSYEPMDLEESDDDRFGDLRDHQRDIHRENHARALASPPVPDKPPLTTASRKKVAKFVQKTQSVPLDQLSMIEEKSTRANSVKSKSLPLLPSSPAGADSPIKRALLRKPPPGMEPVLEAPVAKRVQSAILNEQPRIGSPEAPKMVTSKSTPLLNTKDTETRGRQPERAGVDNLAPPVVVNRYGPQPLNYAPAPPNGSLRQSTAFHHNLNNGTEAELRIAKRTFSDESHVSSVSSFSSVGDFFNVHFGASSPRPRDANVSPRALIKTSQQEATRNASGASTSSSTSEASQSSWNSVQKSLDFSLKDSVSNSSQSPEPKSDPKALDNNDIADDTIDADILPLNIPAKANSKLVKVDDTNNGAGIGFNFPNNTTNVTNQTKKKSLPARQSASSYSLVSPTGQIEIPNLDELSIEQTPGETEKIEPIGMPSRAARAHFKSMYGDSSTDSDSDSSFNSQFSKMNKTNKNELSPIKEMRAAPKNILATSPIRHARQRSMYNIDFESTDIQVSPHRKHNRSKSAADMVNLSPAKDFKFGNPNIEKKVPEAVSRADDKQQFVVAEPPQKVQYAVDFRTASETSRQEEPFHVKGPVDFYRRSARSTTSRSSHSEYHTPAASDIASSYQSSRTAGETASTAPTDNDSVMIDLTKDGYNVCMIKRNDSQMSYRSVIEKTKDGKDVEVVLVDEEDEADTSFNDRDDLSSIYSKYMSDWVVRSDSVKSAASEVSTASTNSWCNSEKNFQVKSIVAARREQEYKQLRAPNLPQKLMPILEQQVSDKTRQTYTKQGNDRNQTVESGYFDYMAGKNYSFIA